MTILEFTPPIKREFTNVVEIAMFNALGGNRTLEKIKRIKKYRRRVINREKLHKKKGGKRSD